MTILMYTMLTWTGVFSTMVGLGALYVTASRLLHCDGGPAATNRGLKGGLTRSNHRLSAVL